MSRTAYLLEGPHGRERFGWFILDAVDDARAGPVALFVPLDFEGDALRADLVSEGAVRIADRQPVIDVLDGE